jgi:AcrR family transcriptional regulator
LLKNLNIHIELSEDLYLKNPESSDLGKRIVCQGIDMINTIGFESFTFKKLGEKLNSNESTIYRYFKNKHLFLLYLTNWYWTWVEYKIVFATTNISSSTKKLKNAIDILTDVINESSEMFFLNEVALYKLISNEGNKSFHTINVNKENQKGYFDVYKNVVNRISHIICEIQPRYKYSHMLVSTVIEGVFQQRFFAENLPSLTDQLKKQDSISLFYNELVLKAIK